MSVAQAYEAVKSRLRAAWAWLVDHPRTAGVLVGLSAGLFIGTKI